MGEGRPAREQRHAAVSESGRTIRCRAGAFGGKTFGRKDLGFEPGRATAISV